MAILSNGLVMVTYAGHDIDAMQWRIQGGGEVRGLKHPFFGRLMHLNGDIWLDPLFILGWDPPPPAPFSKWLDPPLDAVCIILHLSHFILINSAVTFLFRLCIKVI